MHQAEEQVERHIHFHSKAAKKTITMKSLFKTITLFAFCVLLGSVGSVFGHETTGRVSSIRGLGEFHITLQGCPGLVFH